MNYRFKEGTIAYKGKRRQTVKITQVTETGAVAQYEPVDEPGMIYMPLIENGRNVEEFEPVISEQISIFGRG